MLAGNALVALFGGFGTWRDAGSGSADLRSEYYRHAKPGSYPHSMARLRMVARLQLR